MHALRSKNGLFQQTECLSVALLAIRYRLSMGFEELSPRWLAEWAWIVTRFDEMRSSEEQFRLCTSTHNQISPAVDDWAISRGYIYRYAGYKNSVIIQ